MLGLFVAVVFGIAGCGGGDSGGRLTVTGFNAADFSGNSSYYIADDTCQYSMFSVFGTAKTTE
jgi:hypothetical protein